jgi:hypothetical protein
MVTFLLIFLLGFIAGIVATILFGAYQHDREIRNAANNPDPKIMSELAAYIVEHSKIKELEKK